MLGVVVSVQRGTGRGQWELTRLGGDRLRPVVMCPGCRGPIEIGDQHSVTQDGYVEPAVQCTTEGCFDARVRLLGWSDR